MTSDITQQKTYFEQTGHQFSQEKIVHSPLSNTLEVEHMMRLLSLPPHAQILDFGAGTGRITIPFLRLGHDVTAVDLSQQSLKQLKSLYIKLKKPSWGKLTTRTSLPVNSSFDAIIGSDILHHIALEKELRTLRVRLKTGGTILFSEPNGLNPLWYVYIFLSLSWPIERLIVNCTITRLKRVFTQAGYTKLNITGHGLLPTTILNYFPEPLARANAHILGNLPALKYFSFRLIIRASK